MTNEGELIAGRYRLVSELGSGAMGVVWQAHDERLHRVVAVKKLLVPPGRSESSAEAANLRAMREGRIAARLHHPHAISVYDVAEHEGKPCLIMEYLRADSLSTVLATRGTLPWQDVAKIGSQIATALTAAHQAGIVHRDIKPGNVLLAEDGTAKITDFGISRAVGDGTLTVTGFMAGTPAYLAPEVAKGQDAGFPADVFSLGTTLYTAVEGAPPYGLDDNALALLYRIATDDISPPTQAGALGPVLMRMLERDPSRRPTMREAHDALCAVAAEPETASTRQLPAVPAAPAPAPAARNKLAVLTAAALPTADAPATRSGTAKPGPPTQGTDRQPRRRSALLPAFVTNLPAAVPAAVVSVFAAAIVLVAIMANDGQFSAEQAGGLPGATHDSADTQPPPAPSADEPTVEEAAPPPPPAPTALATPDGSGQDTPAPSPDQDAAPAQDTTPPQDTAEQRRAAVADYYALMPHDLHTGWARLTGDYQANHAGGFDAYQAFWAPIEQVGIAEVTATPPGTVSATLTYVYQDGRTVVERTTFGLVNEGGIWKIASSTVNSSTTRS